MAPIILLKQVRIAPMILRRASRFNFLSRMVSSSFSLIFGHHTNGSYAILSPILDK